MPTSFPRSSPDRFRFDLDAIVTHANNHLFDAELLEPLDETAARAWKKANAPLVGQAWETISRNKGGISENERDGSAARVAARRVLARYTRARLALDRFKSERKLPETERRAAELDRLDRRLDTVVAEASAPHRRVSDAALRQHLAYLVARPEAQSRAAHATRAAALASPFETAVRNADLAQAHALDVRCYHFTCRAERVLDVLERRLEQQAAFAESSPASRERSVVASAEPSSRSTSCSNAEHSPSPVSTLDPPGSRSSSIDRKTELLIPDMRNRSVRLIG